MLIDLHCHTKKTKTGEADTRDVSKEIFLDKVDEANVKLVAITNHNHFDYEQYIEFEEIAKETCMVWPGIEFDVECNGIRGHIITISDPDKVEEFNDLVQGLLGDTSPDQFYVDISLLSETFDDLGVLFIAHFNKSEELPLNDLHSFEQTLTKAILFKEPAKLISIGILATHGHLAILGSDVKDWDDYYNCNFAEIKFEISGYNQFIQLAKKNPHMVKHFLDISFKYDIQVYPHQNTKITIPIYNDINTIIGDKGTGKTEIIKSLETYFNQEDINNTVYRGGDKEKWYEDLIEPLDVDHAATNMNQDNCKNNFQMITEYTESNVTEIAGFYKHFKDKSDNKKSRKMIIKNVATFNIINSDNLEIINGKIELTNEFIESVLSDIQEYLPSYEKSEIEKQAKDLLKLLVDKNREIWIEGNAKKLTNHCIDTLRDIISAHTGEPPLPTNTGFLDFVQDRIRLKNNVNKIQQILLSDSVYRKELIGTLEDKGEVKFTAKFQFYNQTNASDIKRTMISRNKNQLDPILRNLKYLSNSWYKMGIGEKITEFKQLCEFNVDSLDSFVAVEKYLEIDDSLYTPSNGEKAILALQHQFLNRTDSEIYLLDEPEMSLSHKYINSAIVPHLIKISKQGKVVIMATHDANLATRTRPVNTVYRLFTDGKYKTYIGNMYTAELVNIEDSSDKCLWRDISLDNLEGGENAFIERGEIYEQ